MEPDFVSPLQGKVSLFPIPRAALKLVLLVLALPRANLFRALQAVGEGTKLGYLTEKNAFER